MMICRFATTTGTPSRLVSEIGRPGSSAANAAPATSKGARKRAANTRTLRETSAPHEHRAHVGGIDCQLVALQVELVIDQVVAAIDDQRVPHHAVILRVRRDAAILVGGRRLHPAITTEFENLAAKVLPTVLRRPVRQAPPRAGEGTGLIVRIVARAGLLAHL